LTDLCYGIGSFDTAIISKFTVYFSAFYRFWTCGKRKAKKLWIIRAKVYLLLQALKTIEKRESNKLKKPDFTKSDRVAG
jgi:hypothetical protein